MIALPPLDDDAVQLTDAWLLPATALDSVGALGAVAGVTALEADDAGPAPAALVATTLKVYAVPLVRPEKTQLVAVEVHVAPPGEAVTV